MAEISDCSYFLLERLFEEFDLINDIVGVIVVVVVVVVVV